MKLSVDNSVRLVAPEFEDEALVWALHDGLGCRGVRFSCGVGECGACTVLIDGDPTFACELPASAVAGSEITTLAVFRSPGTDPHVAAVRAGFETFPMQCMYCVSGHALTALAMLRATTSPSAADVEEAIARNLCRCGGYNQVRSAVAFAANILRESKPGQQ
jgi:aerobic-type carbon monoxide dehydrogenase small subunit (CoxS/CutS family)